MALAPMTFLVAGEWNLREVECYLLLSKAGFYGCGTVFSLDMGLAPN